MLIFHTSRSMKSGAAYILITIFGYWAAFFGDIIKSYASMVATWIRFCCSITSGLFQTNSFIVTLSALFDICIWRSLCPGISPEIKHDNSKEQTRCTPVQIQPVRTSYSSFHLDPDLLWNRTRQNWRQRKAIVVQCGLSAGWGLSTVLALTRTAIKQQELRR